MRSTRKLKPYARKGNVKLLTVYVHMCRIMTTDPFDLIYFLLNYSSESEFHLSVTDISLNINVKENS